MRPNASVAPGPAGHGSLGSPEDSVRFDLHRRVAVMSRHTMILLARDPGTLVAYTVMSAVLLLVLRPVYERLGTPGVSPVLQETAGITVMFTLLALDVAGQVLLSERTWRTWDRLRASPAGSAAVLTGKALPLIVVFFAQQAAAFAFAAVALGFDLAGGSWRLPVMSLCWAICVTSGGLALGVWVKTQGQLAAAADIVALSITCLSGCLVPLSILPRWVALVARFTPGYWAQRGFEAAVTGDAAVYGRSIAVVAGVSVAALVLAAVRARGRGRGRPIMR